ncbi:MAG TPA: MarR family transcriptional regulator [Marmoricola sp.]|nr:MarR family transcriptional regulator [Marmoricola sp.]
MSRPDRPSPDYVPLIALVHRLSRALQLDMAQEANRRGHVGIKNSHNVVFATLDPEGSRASDMAAQAGMTRQSMGEIVRELVELGVVEMRPDPKDRRAKLVTWTDHGLEVAREGYEHILEVEDRFAAELGAEQFARLRTSLVRMTAMLDESTEEA